MDMNQLITGWLATFKKYTVFEGRSARQEFWTWTLINLAVMIVLNIVQVTVEGVTGLSTGPIWLANLFALATMLPSIGVGARRLHDAGKTGWLMLLGLIPCVGLIVLIVFWCQDSQPGDNQFGPNPKSLPAAG